MLYVVYKNTLVCTDRKPFIDEDAIEFGRVHWMGSTDGYGFTGSEKFFVLIEDDEERINKRRYKEISDFNGVRKMFVKIARNAEKKHESVKAFFEPNLEGNN